MLKSCTNFFSPRPYSFHLLIWCYDFQCNVFLSEKVFRNIFASYYPFTCNGGKRMVDWLFLNWDTFFSLLLLKVYSVLLILTGFFTNLFLNLILLQIAFLTYSETKSVWFSLKVFFLKGTCFSNIFKNQFVINSFHLDQQI